MRANSTVYILGAGFSADAGVPVVKPFLQRVRELHDNPHSELPDWLQLHFRRVLRFRKEAKHSRDSVSLNLDDIETLFSLVDMSSLPPGRSTSGEDPSVSIKHVIAHTVSTNIVKGSRYVADWTLNEGETQSALPAHMRRFLAKSNRVTNGVTLLYWQYEFFAALLAGDFESTPPGHQDTVVSFNYDTVLENALWNIGCAVDYGPLGVLKSTIGEAEHPSPPIKLLKLHGSANWVEGATPTEHAKAKRTYADVGRNQAPLLVPPTWRKGSLSPTFAQIWGAARDAIAQASRICIIGYSMPQTDPFFQHLMASALGENDGLYTLTVVDRQAANADIESLSQRYRSLFRPLSDYDRLKFEWGGLDGYLGRFREESPHRGRGARIQTTTVKERDVM